MPRAPSSLHLRAVFSRVLARVVSVALACALVVGAAPVQAASAPDSNEVERLYNEGSTRNANKNYSGAAESWTELLSLLDEKAANQSTRENVLLNVLDAYMNAYNGTRKPDNTKDITHLRNAQRVLERYLGAFQSAYGRGKGVSPAVQQKANELDELLKKAEEEPQTPVPPPVDGPKTPPTNGTTDTPPPPPPIQLPPEKNGVGLIAGGAVMIGVGVGALALLIVGGVQGKKYENTVEDKNVEYGTICPAEGMPCTAPNAQGILDDRDEAQRKGENANKLLIAGAVIAPLLIAGGAVMLVFGVKRNREARAAAQGPTARFRPAVGPRFNGLVIEGRF